MITLFKTELAREFLTLERDAFIRLAYTGTHKTHFKAKSETEAYGKALMELGFGEIFGIKDPVELAETYVTLAINYNYAISETEKHIFKNASEKVKSQATGKVRKLVDANIVEKHNLTEDEHLKVICAAKYIAKSFCNMTNHYTKFIEGKLDGEELVTKLKEFIENNYDVIIDDTNVAYNIPRSLSQKNRIKIYLPTSTDLEIATPIDHLLNEVILELNDGRNYCLPSALYGKVINIFVNQKNLYTFYEDSTSCHTILEVDLYARRYMVRTIQHLLEPTFYLGNPMTVEETKAKAIVYGNYDSTLTLYINNQVVIIDKESYGMAKNALTNYKPCSMNKSLGVVKNEEKVLLWDCIFSNAKPVDGNYNNITKKNVQ